MTRWLSGNLLQARQSRRQLLAAAGALGIATRLPARSGGVAASAPARSQTAGGTLTVAYDEEEASLDFPKATRTSGRVAFSMNMGDGLFFLNEAGEVSPWLAESYEQPSPESYVFNLRQGVKFHDGTAFTAEAVKFSFDRLVDPAFQAGRGNLFPIASTEATGEHTVQVTLKAPFAPFILQLTDPVSYIVSPSAVEAMGNDEFGRNPVGTGPFKFVEWVSGDHITMEAFDEYWRGRPLLDRVVWRLIRDPDARAAQLQAGDVQMAVSLPEAQLAILEGDDSLVVNQRGSVRWFGIGINTTCQPFDIPAARQAVQHAIDRQGIVDQILLGVGEVNNQPLNRGVFGYNPELRTVYDYDPDRARQLLADAGLADGFDTSLVVSPGYSQPAMEAVQANLSEVGIRAELELVEAAAFTEMRNNGELCLASDSWGAIYNDADFGLYPKFHSSSIVPNGFNMYFLNDPEVDRLLDAGRSELDEAAREQHYFEAIERLQEQAVFVPISRFVFINGFSEQLQNVRQTASDQWWLAEAWLSE